MDVRHISRRFGNLVALKDVGFSARPGEILGLVGTSGAGKTTLLDILSCMLSADSGTVSWGGTLRAPSERKDVLCYVPEAVTPYPVESARKLLGMFGRLFGCEEERQVETIRALRLGPVMERRVAHL